MEWKPISEFPEKSGIVILACIYNENHLVREGWYYEGSKTFDLTRFISNDIVITHWMPMPEHPMYRG